MERTLVLIKPDAMQRGLAGEVLRRLEARGLRIAALKLIQVDRALPPPPPPGFGGSDAIEAVRPTIGKTNPREAAPGTIRGDLGLEIGRNLIHGSDSLASAARELDLFFHPAELL